MTVETYLLVLASANYISPPLTFLVLSLQMCIFWFSSSAAALVRSLAAEWEALAEGRLAGRSERKWKVTWSPQVAPRRALRV